MGAVLFIPSSIKAWFSFPSPPTGRRGGKSQFWAVVCCTHDRTPKQTQQQNTQHLHCRCFVTAVTCVCQQPDPPISLSSTSGSIATQVWQVAAKENQLEKVQDELHQVSISSGNSKAARATDYVEVRVAGTAAGWHVTSKCTNRVAHCHFAWQRIAQTQLCTLLALQELTPETTAVEACVWQVASGSQRAPPSPLPLPLPLPLPPPLLLLLLLLSPHHCPS